MAKVLITDFVHEHLVTGLEQLGYSIDYDKDILLADTKKIIRNYEGIIINSKTVMDKEMIHKAKKLKFIGRLGSGLEIIDLAYANKKGVEVFNSPEGNRNAVAEHALGMILSLANNLIHGHNDVKEMNWNRELRRGFELEGKTIGIIGFGNTGSAFAKILSGFDVNILAYDKYKADYTNKLEHVQQSSLEDIKKEADIISFHLPLNKETYHLVNQNFLSSLRQGAIIVNTSRGKIINTLDLIEGLEKGYLGGACLDVFENEKAHHYTIEEKNMYKSLFIKPNVVLSPHVAGWTNESLYKIADTLLKKIKNMS